MEEHRSKTSRFDDEAFKDHENLKSVHYRVRDCLSGSCCDLLGVRCVGILPSSSHLSCQTVWCYVNMSLYFQIPSCFFFFSVPSLYYAEKIESQRYWIGFVGVFLQMILH